MSGSTSGTKTLAPTIPERLRANARRADVADFLRLLHAQRASETLSYRQVLQAAQRFATFYRQQGLTPGQRVVIVLQHSPDLYAAFAGALLGGFVPSIWSFASPKISDADYFRMLAALVENADPKLLITYAELGRRLAGMDTFKGGSPGVCLASEVPAAVDSAILHDETRAESRGRIDEPPDPDDTAVLQYSSGTTGLKKGVALSHRALLWQVDRYAEAIRLGEDDKIVSWLPLYHDMGLICCLFVPLLCRVPLVAMSPFDWVRRPAMWLRAVSDYGCTLSWLPNFAYSLSARQVTDAELAGIDLSSLRGVVNCSEPIIAASHEQFCRRFEPLGFRVSALCSSYAMAENTFAVTSGGFDQPLRSDCIDGREFARTGRAIPVEPSAPQARELVSSGTALPETTIRIVSDTGKTLPQRRVGEIVLQSPCLLSEYYRNQAATRAALRDGVCYTGDLGYLADGELYVTGRKKDLIIIRGQNLHPQDVEMLVSETPGVIPGRVAAVGVPNEDLGTEDLVILAETHQTDPAGRDALRSEILRRVGTTTDVAPRDIRLLEHMWLRKSTSGKISREINRERYLELRRVEDHNHRDPSAATPAAPALEQVRGCVRRVLAQSPAGSRISLGDDDALITSGLMDSLGLVALLNTVEADCNVTIPPETLADVQNVDTIRRLAAAVEQTRQRGPRANRRDTFPRCPADVRLARNQPRTVRPSIGFWTAYYHTVFWWHGVRVGRGLKVRGPLLLRFDGDPGHLIIGDNVTLMPWVDLKVRENGRIILHHDVVLDTNTRLVAANNARLELGEAVQVGIGTIINAGENVIVGRRTAIAGYCTIIASEHNYLGKEPVMQQGYRHDPVYIGEDVWVAANVFIGRGSRIGDGAVLGVKSLVQGDVPAGAVMAGNPARIVRFRG